MAAMTPATVRARLMTLLEDSSPYLTRSIEAFSLDRQPNVVVDNSYTLKHELVSEQSQTASVTARMDRVTITIGRLLKTDSEAAVRALHDVLMDVDRRVRADGVSQGYHVWPISNRVLRPDGRDYCLGELSWTCDYDFSETVV
jgi:hypothetical protein